MKIRAIKEDGQVLASVCNGWVFTSQFTGSGDADNQMRSALLRLKDAAIKAGLAPQGYVKATVTVSKEEQLVGFAEAYREIIGAPLPALTALILRNPLVGADFGIEVVGVASDMELRVERCPHNDNRLQRTVRAGNFTYTSLCLPRVCGSFQEEAESVLESLMQALAAANCPKEAAVKNTVFLTDCARFGDFNAVYAEYFRREEAPPARSLLGVSRLPGGAQVAVDCVACTASERRVLHSDKLATSKMPFSQGVAAGGFVFISGQIGRDSAGIFQHPLSEEARQMFRNALCVASEAGAGERDILKINSYLRHIEDRGEYTALLDEQFCLVDAANGVYAIDGFATPVPLVELDAIAVDRIH